jgi:hypothetical protein
MKDYIKQINNSSPYLSIQNKKINQMSVKAQTEKN